MIHHQRKDGRICSWPGGCPTGPAEGVFTKQTHFGKTNPFALPGDGRAGPTVGPNAAGASRVVLEDASGGKLNSMRELVYVLDQGVVRIGTREQVSRKVHTRVYDTRDILRYVSHYRQLHARRPKPAQAWRPRMSPAGGFTFGGMEDAAGAPDGQPAPEPSEPAARTEPGPHTPHWELPSASGFKGPSSSLAGWRRPGRLPTRIVGRGPWEEASVDDLRETVEDIIMPDTWGTEAAMRSLAGLLVVTQTAEGHQGVSHLLDQIRRHLGTRLSQRPETAPPEDVPTRKTRQKLAARLPNVELREMSLEAAMEWLRQDAGLNIHVNWRELEVSGIKPGTRITLKLTDVTAGKALRIILEEVSGEFVGSRSEADFRIADGVVHVTTREVIARRALTRIYDVSDIAENPSGDGVEGGPGSELAALLEEHVPLYYSGDPRIRPLGDLLIATQTAEEHEAIQTLLDGIRAALHSRRLLESAAIATAAADPEAVFTATGQLAAWASDLLAAARDGKLSRFSSVKTAAAGGRRFARISGVWLNLSLSRKAKLYPVAARSPAGQAAVKAVPTIRECVELGPYVVVAVDDTAGMCLGPAGITDAKDKRAAGLFAALKESTPGKRSR